eukprot:scaffold280973_cov19-Tisochrysis_lutea.AAC.1
MEHLYSLFPKQFCRAALFVHKVPLGSSQAAYRLFPKTLAALFTSGCNSRVMTPACMKPQALKDPGHEGPLVMQGLFSE